MQVFNKFLVFKISEMFIILLWYISDLKSVKKSKKKKKKKNILIKITIPFTKSSL